MENKKKENPSESCILCNKKQQKSNFNKLYPNISYDNNFLMDSENFYVVTDLYPISSEHFLIIPKKHYTSYSMISYKLDDELNQLIKKITKKKNMEKFILFEHGAGIINDKIVGCGNSVFHAHIHLVGGLRYNLLDILKLLNKESDLQIKELHMKHCANDKKEIGIIKQIQKNCKKKELFSPYLFVRYNQHECLVIPEKKLVKIKSQFFRKIFATEISGKKTFWNWKNRLGVIDKHLLKGRQKIMITHFKTKKNKKIEPTITL